MAESILSEKFYFSFVTFLLRSKHQLIAIGHEFGLTNMQTLTLLIIETVKTPSMSSFCKLYECDASNITGIIDGLEQKQLVARCPYPNDRRIKIIKLEAAGQALRHKLISRLAETGDFQFSVLTAAELQQFAYLIQKLASAPSSATE